MNIGGIARRSERTEFGRSDDVFFCIIIGRRLTRWTLACRNSLERNGGTSGVDRFAHMRLRLLHRKVPLGEAVGPVPITLML